MEEKRQYKRITVKEIAGSMFFASKVEIINISLGGAAIQLNKSLALGKEYSIKLENQGRKIELNGIVVWSVLKGSKKQPYGDVVPIYQVGVKFNDTLPPKAVELIGFIETNQRIENEKRLRGVRFKISRSKGAMLDYSFDYRVKLISQSGMLIETMQAFKPEEKLPMEIVLKGGRPVRFIGRVASCTEIKDKHPVRYDMGVEFIQIADNDRAEIKAYIKSISA
ncbi:MAG: PilZ domain-containing protein [Nitrospirae bacterium]|nr:PilZ domain-containing protein [Nitrospirota bacterium]